MKRIKILLSTLTAAAMLLPAALHAQEGTSDGDAVGALWKHATDAYSEKRFDEAIESFTRISEMGYGSAELYYNLGNAYFKAGQGNISAAGRPFASGELGRAVLNYRRALKIDPSMSDAQYNLDLAVDYTNDTDGVPEFVLARVWRSLRDMLSSNAWGILSIVLLALMLTLAMLYLLSRNIARRKAGFYGALLLAVLFVLTTLLAASQRAVERRDDQAVVICRDTAPVHSSPDSETKIIREPSQGVTVTVGRTLGGWREITFADGEKGWIRNDDIELIR